MAIWYARRSAPSRVDRSIKGRRLHPGTCWFPKAIMGGPQDVEYSEVEPSSGAGELQATSLPENTCFMAGSMSEEGVRSTARKLHEVVPGSTYLKTAKGLHECLPVAFKSLPNDAGDCCTRTWSRKARLPPPSRVGDGRQQHLLSPDLDAVLRIQPHAVAGLGAEGLMERIHVLRNLVAAELARRVRICGDAGDHGFRTRSACASIRPTSRRSAGPRSARR